MTAITGTLVYDGPFFWSELNIAVVSFTNAANTNTFAIDGGTPDLNGSSITAVWAASDTDPDDKVLGLSHDGSTITFQIETTFPATNKVHLFILYKKTAI